MRDELNSKFAEAKHHGSPFWRELSIRECLVTLTRQKIRRGKASWDMQYKTSDTALFWSCCCEKFQIERSLRTRTKVPIKGDKEAPGKKGTKWRESPGVRGTKKC